MNPRYIAYCEAQGNDPDTQLSLDRAKYPGGCMAGFIVWCSENPDTIVPYLPELEHDLGGEG